MNYKEYRDTVLDVVSPSFCAAKWYNATVWLGNGMTASCHHPPAHKINPDSVKENPKALHNTPIKKQARLEMLNGIRPSECEYCWKIEDIGEDAISDRVFKSIIYSEEDLSIAANTLKSTGDVDLKTLEIAFDANCNFACSYCNASFSTSWMKDIRTNGQYVNLISDGGSAFTHGGEEVQPYGPKNENNPYVEAFMKWWESDLQYSLDELRITGGEATMSPDFWKLVDWWNKNPNCNVRLAVNSNLGAKKELMAKLCRASHDFKVFDLYTSNESFGSHAEYIRDGLVWDTWIRNIRMMLTEGNVRILHMMMTINSLCLFSLPEFMDEMISIKKEFGKFQAIMSFNILRFPSFMSVLVLPEDIRLERALALEAWVMNNWTNVAENERLIAQNELDGLLRLIEYLRTVDVGHSNTSDLTGRLKDFKSFFSQYDVRRNKSFEQTFPELGPWYSSINVRPVFQIKEIK